MAETKTVTLSDGRVATVRRPKMRDMIRAQDAIAGEPHENRFKFTCALLAQVVMLEGRPCVMEDIQELFASDCDRLAKAAGGDFLSPAAPSSSGSSSAAFDSKS